MNVIRRRERGAEVLALQGRLTAGKGVTVLREMEPTLVDGRGHHLVIDLSRVDYVDAAGVGELLRLRRRAMARGTNLVLSGLTSRVQDVLGVTRLSDELQIAADVDEALCRVDSVRGRTVAPVTAAGSVSEQRTSNAYHIPVIVAL